jgi:hypothetical protein
VVDVRVLLKLANFPQKRTTRPAKFFCVFLQARQDTHIALLQNGLAKSVHITLAGSIPSLPNVILRLAKRGDRCGKERYNYYDAPHSNSPLH